MNDATAHDARLGNHLRVGSASNVLVAAAAAPAPVQRDDWQRRPRTTETPTVVAHHSVPPAP